MTGLNSSIYIILSGKKKSIMIIEKLWQSIEKFYVHILSFQLVLNRQSGKDSDDKQGPIYFKSWMIILQHTVLTTSHRPSDQFFCMLVPGSALLSLSLSLPLPLTSTLSLSLSLSSVIQGYSSLNWILNSPNNVKLAMHFWCRKHRASKTCNKGFFGRVGQGSKFFFHV